MRHIFARAAIALLLTFALGSQAIAQATLRPDAARIIRQPAIDLRQLQLSLPQAELEYYFYGDVHPIATVKYVDPGAAYREVEFRTNIFQKSKVHAVRWEVSRLPFTDSAAEPAGMLATGTTSDRVFAIDFAAIARKAGLLVPATASGGRPALSQATVNTAALRQAGQAATRQQAPTVNAAAQQAIRSQLVVAANGARFLTAPRFFVRVVPVDPANPARTIGKPSAPLPVIWGKAPNRELEVGIGKVVSEESYHLAFAGFTYHPPREIRKWPSGCTEAPRDNGKDAWDVISDAPEAAVDFVNWASKAYADLKNAVISIAAFLLPFVPREVLSIALDAAMASAGIPPSLPNVDQLMNSGADYLATQMAAQIPVPEADLLTEAALEQARAEVREKTKEVILQSAKEIEARAKSQYEYCSTRYETPYFEVKVRNNGAAALEHVTLTVKPETDLLTTMFVPIERIEAGEVLAIPVPYAEAKDVPYRWVSQMPNADKRAALSEWWSEFTPAQFRFVLSLPGGETCYGDGTCYGGKSAVTFRTNVQRWYDYQVI